MPSNIIFLDDASNPVSNNDFGAVNAGSSQTLKNFIANEGSSGVNSLVLSLESIAGNDGVTYALIAQDDGTGNPGTFSASDLFIGDFAAGAQIPIWIQVLLPNGATPAGNPRQFALKASYDGV